MQFGSARGSPHEITRVLGMAPASFIWIQTGKALWVDATMLGSRVSEYGALSCAETGENMNLLRLVNSSTVNLPLIVTGCAVPGQLGSIYSSRGCSESTDECCGDYDIRVWLLLR